MAPRTPKASESSETAAIAPATCVLIHGDDDFLVQEEARKVLDQLRPAGSGEFGVEIVEGGASNQGEASLIFKKLFDHLQSQSFFSSDKVVWLRSTNLLGAGTTASAAAVSESLKLLQEFIAAGLPPGVSLLITATEVDGRKAVVKTIQKSGKVIAFKTDPFKQQEAQVRGVTFAKESAQRLGKKLSTEAATLIVEMAGGDTRTIASEMDKLATYAGEGNQITEEEVRIIGSWRPGGVVWDLPDALGERNLRRALEVLDNLLFLGETPVGLLFALIARVRLLLLLRELLDAGMVRSGADYNSFKSQMERLPAWVQESLPEDRKLNPLAGHPFAVWKAFAGASRYSGRELHQAMKELLECNRRMVTGGGVPRHLLEQSLIKICMKSERE